MTHQRISEDFVKHYKLLVERTGNSPNGIRRALERDPRLAISIREIDNLWYLLETYRKLSKRRFIYQAHSGFADALKDYGSRWRGAKLTLLDWEDEKAGREPLSVLLDRFFGPTANDESKQSKETLGDEEWDFDPDLHSAAKHIEGIMHDYLAQKCDDGPFFSRAAGAFEWFTMTVGIDFQMLEKRWREFPVIVVPKQVSDRHGIDDPRSLFAYLENVRLAYMIGADLSAVATCRAVTEILFRYHYNDHDHDEKTGLYDLIKRTQQNKNFAFMRKRNFVEKIVDANRILHRGNEEIQNVDRSRTLIRDWVNALQELIAKAP